MGPIVCPDTSVINYHHSLRNDPEERSSQLLRGETWNHTWLTPHRLRNLSHRRIIHLSTDLLCFSRITKHNLWSWNNSILGQYSLSRWDQEDPFWQFDKDPPTPLSPNGVHAVNINKGRLHQTAPPGQYHECAEGEAVKFCDSHIPGWNHRSQDSSTRSQHPPQWVLSLSRPSPTRYSIDTHFNTLPSVPEAPGDAVGWSTTLQTGRSRVRFPMVSSEFFIDIILPVALWPWGRISL